MLPTLYYRLADFAKKVPRLLIDRSVYVQFPSLKNYHLLKSFVGVIFLSTYLSVGYAPAVFAISSEQQDVLSEGIDYFNSGTCASSQEGGGTVATTLSGSDNAQQIFNFFQTEGLSYAQTIGVMANLYEQSGLNPEKVQDPGGVSKTPTTGETEGWGLAQWTGPGPVNPVVADAASYHITTPIYELVTQLNIIWQEMNHSSPYGGVYDMAKYLEQINDPVQAANYFQSHFEGGEPGATASDVPVVEGLVKGDSSPAGGPTTTTTSTSPAGCNSVSVGSVACNNGLSTDGTTGLSSVRQQVVCLAEQQYSIWSSKPVSYRYNGFLPYSQGIYEEWCADFVSWVFHESNYPLKGGLNGWGYASVGSIQQIGEDSGSGFTWHPEGDGYTPQPGDIAIYDGRHTAIVVSVSGGTPIVIGGDEDPDPDGVYGGNITTTPPNPPSESTVNKGTLLDTAPGPGTFTGYVSPDASN